MIWLLLACETVPSAQDLEQTLNAQDSLEDCARMPLEGARITCQVTQAARAGALGDVAGVDAACAGLVDIWQYECRFRAGEELGKAGKTDAALRQCAQAKDFARNCVTHAAWGLPKREGLSPSEDVGPAMAEFDALVSTALVGAPKGVAPEAVDTLMARAWFNLYVGSGSADPTAASTASSYQAHARSAWAIEATRLLDSETAIPEALACWSGGACPTGAPLLQPKGRYSTPIVVPATETHPHVAGFGGSIRLAPASAEEDLIVALLEGQFFRESSSNLAFVDYLDAEKDAIRWTACKLQVLAGGEGSSADGSSADGSSADGSSADESTCVAYEALALQTRKRMQKRDRRAATPQR
ncbi:MAG: hypothetical protein ACI9VR_002916 [Cognaticolwellia sp.]